MTVLKIELIDPRVKAILEDLANMDLIRIQEEGTREDFSALLHKFRSRAEEAPGIEEITEEVEAVRSQRQQSNG